ncbi:MAG: hypothetical protein ABIJ12_10250 [bacterium]
MSSKKSNPTKNGSIIRKIIFHFEPHLDEYFAAYLARSFGGKVWIDIANAKIVTKDGSVTLVDRKDWLPIGVGEGPFDEHGPDKDPELCAADLIAQFLEIENDKKISILLKMVRTGDGNGQSTPLDLSQCVRMLTHVGWSPTKIEAWLKVFLDCFFDDRTTIKNGRMETKPDSIEFPVGNSEARILNELFEKWLITIKKGGDPQQIEKCIGHLRKNLALLTKRAPSKIFDLVECCSLIAAYHPNNEDIIFKWVEPIFNACLQYQTDFLAACDIIKSAKIQKIKPSPDCQPKEIIQVMGINQKLNASSNRCLVSAAKYLNKNLDVLIIQQPSGNVQIFILRHWHYYLLPMIVRAIRLEEMIASGFLVANIDSGYNYLATPGRIDNPAIWYLPLNDKGDGYALFNGSLTMPSISPTKIIFNWIVGIISKMVLIDDTEKNWDDYAQIRISQYETSMKSSN